MSLKELLQRCNPPHKHENIVAHNECYYLRSLGDNPRKQVADFPSQYPNWSKDFKFPSVLSFGRSSHDEKSSGRRDSLESNQGQLKRDIEKDSHGGSTVPENYFSSVFRVSSAGCQLWTHYDITNNLLCQLTGTKRVVLYPPHQVRNLYVHTSSSRVIDIDNPDYELFPKFRLAEQHRRECILQPGDVLFIPSLWFHNVLSFEASVSVNIFWQHLPPEFFQKRDLYGNKELVQGEEVLQNANQIVETLRRLPQGYYRDFYLEKVLALLEDSSLQ